MDNQTNNEEFKKLDKTRRYVQSDIVHYCKNIHTNAKNYTEEQNISGLRRLTKRLYYHFLKTQLFLNKLCTSLIKGKKYKTENLTIYKKKIAREYFKGFDCCVSSKFNSIMNQVGLTKNIKSATQMLGYSIRPVKRGNSMEFGLVVDELSGKDSVGPSVK